MSMQDLHTAIRAAGYEPPAEIVWDGALHRFATDPNKSHSKDGWYVAYDDHKGRAAAFGSWRDGASHTWSNGTGRKLTEAELAAIEASKAKALAEEKKRRDAAALRAARLYEQASTNVAYSGYLARKGIQCPVGVRAVQAMAASAFGFEGDWQVSGLIVPMVDKSGKIRSLQIIPENPKLNKLFMKGGQTAACFHVLGEIEHAPRILIAEGLATAQSAHEGTGLPAVVAFFAHNLEAVARIIRDKNATADIILLVDDDDAGRTASAAAAKACNGKVVFAGHGCNDFNDLHAAKGLEAVKAAILGQESEQDAELWRADLIIKHKADGTQIIPCRVHNLILILANAEQFRGRIRFNEFSGQVSIDGEDIKDASQVWMKAELEKGWIEEKIPTADVKEALIAVAGLSPYHPVREWLDTLKWDGIERIERFCSDNLHTENDPYHMAVSKSIFISAVMRVYHPGCKVDTMCILEGEQGLGKSMVWNTLFSPWYAEVVDSLNTKDFFIGLSGVWCADFGELDQFSKAEATRIKQIISSQMDNYRGLWQGAHAKHPRQCIFVGGTNHEDWQGDATGARRFLPVKVKHAIDIEKVRNDREQLFAEAVHLVKSKQAGEWWNIPEAKKHQDNSYVGDPWEAPILDHLAHVTENTSTSYILTDVLRIEFGKQTRHDQMRIAAILKRAEFERIKASSGKWVYQRKQAPNPPTSDQPNSQPNF